MSGFTFWLGIHQPEFIGQTNVPLFPSHSTMRKTRTLHRATGPLAVDSGAFSELTLRGGDAYPDGVEPYVDSLRRYRDQLGRLDWAGQQGWMCEADMLTRTGMTVPLHQDLTIRNNHQIRDYAPDFLMDGTAWHVVRPELQGAHPGDYIRCLQKYDDAGINLRWPHEPFVGLGSVCRRAHTNDIRSVVRDLCQEGVRLHLYGVAVRGLAWLIHEGNGGVLSSDSLSWSYTARQARYHRNRLIKHGQGELDTELAGDDGRSRANRLDYALHRRAKLLRSIGQTDHHTERTAA